MSNSDSDAVWRRPPGSAGPGQAGPGSAGHGPAGHGPAGPGHPGGEANWAGVGRVPGEPEGAPYQGPPRAPTPPAGWHPPTVYEPEPPRTLPAQDLKRLDREEAAARTLTKGIALVAAAVMLVILLVLCGRLLF